MRRLVAVAVALVAVFGMVVPAMAQAPAPKVTITGIIDQIGTFTKNMSKYDNDYGRAKDDETYGRTRGRFDIVGEVGAAKAVLGLEIDAYWGQSGSSDTALGGLGGKQGFGANGGWDINTDTVSIIEVKWLYTEFPMFLVPETKVRLGAQPFGTAATYKLAAYANGDFPGVNWVTRFGPAAALNLTYVRSRRSSRVATLQLRPRRPASPGHSRSAERTGRSSPRSTSRPSRASTSSRCTRTSTRQA